MKRAEAAISLKPCVFYGGYPYMKKETAHCELGNCQTGCSGDFEFCENMETFRKYLRETGLGWQDWGRKNGTD